MNHPHATQIHPHNSHNFTQQQPPSLASLIISQRFPSTSAHANPFLTITRALNLLHQSHQLHPLNSPTNGGPRRTSSTSSAPTQTTATTPSPKLPLTASNVSNPLCRICRGSDDQPGQPLIECPCRCRGSMGHVHAGCLQRWHLVRKQKVCEICHQTYEFPDPMPPPNSAALRFHSFFRREYLGLIVKSMLNFGALTFLTYQNSVQLPQFVEAVSRRPTSGLLIMLYLMGSGVANFTYFEWTLNAMRKMLIVLEHWWNRPLIDAVLVTGGNGAAMAVAVVGANTNIDEDAGERLFASGSMADLLEALDNEDNAWLFLQSD